MNEDKVKIIEKKDGSKFVDLKGLMKGEYSIMEANDPKNGTKRKVFFHEYVYSLAWRKPIKKGCLIAHKDNNLENDHPDNLIEVPSDNNDYHIKKNKIFHEDVIDKRKAFIKLHFKDIYDALELNKPLADRDYFKRESEEIEKAKKKVIEKITKEHKEEQLASKGKNVSIESDKTLKNDRDDKK